VCIDTFFLFDPFEIRSVSRSETRTSIYGNYKSETGIGRCHSDCKAKSRISSSCCFEVRKSDFWLPKLHVRKSDWEIIWCLNCCRFNSHNCLLPRSAIRCTDERTRSWLHVLSLIMPAPAASRGGGSMLSCAANAVQSHRHAGQASRRPTLRCQWGWYLITGTGK